MNIHRNKILAVAVCNKRIGLSIFSLRELIYFAVKTLKSPRTSEHVKQQVSETIQLLLAEYEPEAVVLKLLGKQQAKSDNLQLIFQIVKQQVENIGIPLYEISFNQAKQALCADKKVTRRNAFKILSEIYPELKQFANHPSHWQAEYYNSLLSAAAVGFYILNKAFNHSCSKNQK